ncbi:MAG: GH92 family glycosyl hydrolase [Streptosporangiaceae bacterium]
MTKTGHLTDCQRPVARDKLPAGTRNESTLSPSVRDLASLVDARTWTTGGGNTFPGADVPYGMVQWSPDTLPDRNAGGGYGYTDTTLTGYALTHVSGPGCGAAGDVPILPVTGALPSGNPNNVTTPFSHTGEVAQAGYYSASSNGTANPITSQFTATTHSSMGQFTFPSSSDAGFDIKLQDGQNPTTADTAQIVGNDEIQGSVTSGDFCGESVNDGQSQLYTVYFDITFNQPFTSSQVITASGATSPQAVYVDFGTANPVIEAKVGISFVSAANAALNWQTENPGWNFGAVKSRAQSTWDQLLGKIKVAGGSYSQTQEFYSLLYKDFLDPQVTSDVNGQFMGADMKVHTLASGQANQYGIFSGWDIYHSLSQLQAMLDPKAASDMSQSLVNYYAEDGILQQWGYLNLNNYVMVGDPSDSIIADAYAFGARQFHTRDALADMIKQATTVNDVRPGEALEQKYGYLPEDGSYACCNPHGQVPTLLEYDTEDFATAQMARALGDTSDATMLQNQANNWVNVFDSATDLLNPRDENGAFVTGISPTTSSPYVEGDAYEYLWNVPNDYAGLFSLLGGNAAVVPELQQYLSQPDGFGMFAQLTNEFDFGEQFALDYAGDPAGTQQAVNNIRNGMDLPGPSGLANNDDLGANSSSFIWEMLGMYPENSGSDQLVLGSPGFPHIAIHLPRGTTITSNAPGASPTRFYVDSLRLNGAKYSKLHMKFSTLARGATLDWTLGASATSWGSAPQDAPASYGPVFAGNASVSPSTLDIQPGASGTAKLSLTSSAGRSQSVNWTATASSGVTVSPASGTLSVGAGGTATASLNVTAGSTDGAYTVTIDLTSSAGKIIPVQLAVVVAKPGDMSPYYNVTGISSDGDGGTANYDGDGFSYSQQALAAAGLTPGGTVTSGGLTYTWPSVPAGQPDAVYAGGQTIPVSTPSGASSLGFLGSATNAASTGAFGTVTVNYTDGTSSTATLGMSDWTLNANASSPSFGNVIIATTPYRNYDGGMQSVNTYIFAQSIPIDSSKTVASITLPPVTTNGSIGIFAISAG